MNSLKVFILVSIFIVVVNAGSLSVHRCQNAKDKVECNSQYTFISPFTKQWQYFYHLCCMMLDNFTVRSHIFHTSIAHCWSIYMHGIQCQPAQENFKTTFPFISFHTTSKEFWRKFAYRYTILVKTNCFVLFEHITIDLMNFGKLACTAFLVNVVWFTFMKLAEISHYVLKNIIIIARKPKSKNQLWLNIHRLMTIA